MTPTQKLIAAIALGVLWIAALVCKHLFPDIDITLLTGTIVSALAGLGVHASMSGSAKSSDSQGGFARLGMMGFLIVFFVPLVLWGCAGAPTPTQANQIRMACAADMGIRPSVDLLLAIPGLAKPEEVAAVVAARTIIDPICKNPDAPVGGDPYALISQATGTVTGILVQLESRKAAGK